MNKFRYITDDKVALNSSASDYNSIAAKDEMGKDRGGLDDYGSELVQLEEYGDEVNDESQGKISPRKSINDTSKVKNSKKGTSKKKTKATKSRSKSKSP